MLRYFLPCLLCGLPGLHRPTVEQFRELCLEEGIEIPSAAQLPMKFETGTLFDEQCQRSE